MDQLIPFNRPGLTGREIEYVADAVSSGHISSGGPFTKRASAFLQGFHQCDDVLLTTSCTDALEMAAMLVGVQPGDVVIVPSYTFTSTALAFAREGARLRFCDINPVTLGLDADHLAELLDDSVRAVVVVHYAGVPCDLDAIVPLCEQFDVDLIEDNAHGLFGTHRGKPLGTFGRLSTLSFHETKNFICGEGGALVVNRPADVLPAHVLLDKGTNRQEFLEGLVDKYSWQGLGSSFGLSDMLAAYLMAQLESKSDVMRQRRNVSLSYREQLTPMVEELGLRLSVEPDTATPADHMFYVLLGDNTPRSAVLEEMRENGVQATFHYVPLHSSEPGRAMADQWADCPVTDDISARLIRLPFYNSLQSDQIDRVVDVFLKAVRRCSVPAL